VKYFWARTNRSSDMQDFWSDLMSDTARFPSVAGICISEHVAFAGLAQSNVALLRGEPGRASNRAEPVVLLAMMKRWCCWCFDDERGGEPFR
jgi:hypothetical protein